MTMISKQGALCSTVLLAAPVSVASFSTQLPAPKDHMMTAVRGATSLAVVMGGAETPLSDIPQSLFGYEDTVLENVNQRAMSLLGQFQEVSRMEQLESLAHSQDSLAQAASVMAASANANVDIDPAQQSQYSQYFTSAESHAAIAPAGLPEHTPIDSPWMLPQENPPFQTSMEGAMSTSWDRFQTPVSLPEVDIAGSHPWETMTMGHPPQLEQLDSDFFQTASQLIADSAVNMNTAAVAEKAAPAAKAAASAAAQATATVTKAAPAAKTAIAQAATNAGMGSGSNKLISELEKTVSSFDSLAAKSGDNLEDAARQLSDQLYQSFATPEGAQAAFADAPKFITKQSDAVVQGALDGAGRILESSTSRIVAKGAETLQAAKETPIKAIMNNVVSVIEQIMKVLLKTMDGLIENFSGYTFSGHMAHFKTSLTELVSQTTASISTASSKIGNLSMEQIVEFMLKEVIYFVQALSGIFLSLLDALLKSFTGDSLAGHIHHLQTSVNSAVSDTIHQLTSTMHDLGQININDAAKLLLSLVAFIAKLLFQIFSAFVIVLSGQGIDEWTIQATGAIRTELAAMAASAAQTGSTVAESSVNELGALLLQLLENTSVVLVEGMQALLESLGFLVQTGGSLAGALATDTVQSVTDSVSMMTANL